MCSITDPLDCPKKVVGDVVGGVASNVAGSAIDKLAAAVAEAVGETVKQLATVWTKVPSVEIASSPTVANIQDSLTWYTAAFAVLGCIVAGGWMALKQRAQPLVELAQSWVVLILITGSGVAAVQLCLQAGDGFSNWILADAGGPAFDKKMTGLLTGLSSSAFGPLLVIVIGFFSIVAGIAQILLMIFRDAILVILCGVWPLTAAAYSMSWGKQWFTRVSSWIVAFILYKPTAALIYAASFEAFGNEKGLRGSLIGMAMMVLAVLALPALMRLCTPAVGSMGSTGGGAFASGLGGAAGAMMGRGGGGGGPSGAAPVPAAATSGSMSPGSPSGAGMAGTARPMSGGATGGRAATGSGAGAAATSGAGSAGGAAAAGAGPAGAAVTAVKSVYDGAQSTAQSVASEEGPHGSGQ